MSEHVFPTSFKLPVGFACEEIIRCKDCRWYEPTLFNEALSEEGGTCYLPDGNGDYARWSVEPMGFCYWAERMPATEGGEDDIEHDGGCNMSEADEKRKSHREREDAIIAKTGCSRSIASWLAYTLPQKGYEDVTDLSGLSLEEAATWWQVGPKKLEVIEKLGAKGSKPKMRAEKGVKAQGSQNVEELKKLCVDLFLCNLMSQNDMCESDCPYASAEGCTAPNFRERMKSFGLLKEEVIDG